MPRAFARGGSLSWPSLACSSAVAAPFLDQAWSVGRHDSRARRSRPPRRDRRPRLVFSPIRGCARRRLCRPARRGSGLSPPPGRAAAPRRAAPRRSRPGVPRLPEAVARTGLASPSEPLAQRGERRRPGQPSASPPCRWSPASSRWRAAGAARRRRPSPWPRGRRGDHLNYGPSLAQLRRSRSPTHDLVIGRRRRLHCRHRLQGPRDSPPSARADASAERDFIQGDWNTQNERRPDKQHNHGT
jgi:hypothetical protein